MNEMALRRRAFVATVGSMTGLAGCLGLSDGGDDTGPSETGTAPQGSLELSFGEGGVFTNENDVKLAVTVSNPRLRETIPVVKGDEIIVDSPEETKYFLFADVRLENRGSRAIEPPKGLYFETDGKRVDRAVIRTPGKKYRDIGRLGTGESATGTIAFPAPADAETATISLRFQTLLESPPARWTTPYGELDTRTADLSRDGLGDPITVSKGDYAYRFTPTDARRTDAYAYGDGKEHSAPEGSTFVLLSVRAENVGEKPVKLPTPYTVRLRADGETIRSSRFKRGDERYPGRVDPTPPGEALSGIQLYEVPASASSFEVRLAVGNQTFATWPIEVGTS